MSYSYNSVSMYHILPPEKKVVPLAVLLAFVIYFSVAVSFYFE